MFIQEDEDEKSSFGAEWRRSFGQKTKDRESLKAQLHASEQFNSYSIDHSQHINKDTAVYYQSAY